MSHRGNLCIDFQDIAIRIAKEQRPAAKRLVGRRRNDRRAALRQRRCTRINYLRRNAKGKLQRHDPNGRQRIIKSRAGLGKS
jgi:hypothetical protein